MALSVGPSATTLWDLAARGAEALLEPWQAYHEGSPEAAEATARALEQAGSGEEGEAARPPDLPTTVEPYPLEAPTWPDCTPPVGSRAYQVHRLPEAEPHWPFPGDHVHFFLRQQNPASGTCFWKRNAEPPHFLNQGERFEAEPDMSPL